MTNLERFFHDDKYLNENVLNSSGMNSGLEIAGSIANMLGRVKIEYAVLQETREEQALVRSLSWVRRTADSIEIRVEASSRRSCFSDSQNSDNPLSYKWWCENGIAVNQRDSEQNKYRSSHHIRGPEGWYAHFRKLFANNPQWLGKIPGASRDTLLAARMHIISDAIPARERKGEWLLPKNPVIEFFEKAEKDFDDGPSIKYTVQSACAVYRFPSLELEFINPGLDFDSIHDQVRHAKNDFAVSARMLNVIAYHAEALESFSQRCEKLRRLAFLDKLCPYERDLCEV